MQSVRSRLAVTLVLSAVETLTRIRGDSRPLTPPPQLRFVGGGGYQETGEEFKQHFIELGGLRPDHDVLDVGCGVGRMAVPLLGYLTGKYEGFDVVPVGIAWCQKHITRQNPRFRFRVADIYNAKYNPRGRQTAATYRFPYADSSFDFVFLTSVFTHLLPADARNYMNEISRVLKPNGTCFATFFLLDDPRLDGAKYEFSIAGDGYWTISADRPEEAVAYEPVSLDRMLTSAELSQRAVHTGSWAGHDGVSLQDIVIANKSESSLGPPPTITRSTPGRRATM